MKFLRITINQTHEPMLYEKGIDYPDQVRKLLTKRTETQDEIVLYFFIENKQGMYPVWKVQDATGIRRENSVARSINTLTNEDRDINKYVDKYGNAPLLKTEETCWNADRSAKVHKWRWNPYYGKPKGVKPGSTLSMFETEGCAV